MDWTLAFILAMPVLFAAFVFGMFKLGLGKTDWNPPPPPGPYKEPSDREIVRIIAWFSLAIYVVLLLYAGPFGAAIGLAALMTFFGLGALVVTCVQEVLFWFKGPKRDPLSGSIVERRPFLRRLLWNFFNSYEVFAYLVP